MDVATTLRTLRNLGNAHGDLGDNAKARDLYERALAIFQREYDRFDRNNGVWNFFPQAACCRGQLESQEAQKVSESSLPEATGTVN